MEQFIFKKIFLKIKDLKDLLREKDIIKKNINCQSCSILIKHEIRKHKIYYIVHLNCSERVITIV